MALASCDPNSITKAATCFQCIPDGERKAVELYILAVAAGLATDKNGVEAISKAAKNFQAIPEGLRDVVQIYLLTKLNGC